MDVSELLGDAIASVKAGDNRKGWALLTQVVKTDPHNEQAWLWLSAVVETDSQKRECLERVLLINPGNEAAKKGLSFLTSGDDNSLSTVQSLPPASVFPRSGVRQPETSRRSFIEPGSAEKRICPNCGAHNVAGKKFCSKCGSKLTSETHHVHSEFQPRATRENVGQKKSKVDTIAVWFAVAGLVAFLMVACFIGAAAFGEGRKSNPVGGVTSEVSVSLPSPTPYIPAWPTPTSSMVDPGDPATISYVLNYVPNPDDGFTIGQRMVVYWLYLQNQGYDVQEITPGVKDRRLGEEVEWQVFQHSGRDNLLIVYWYFYLNGEFTTVKWLLNIDTGAVVPDDYRAREIYGF